MLAVRRRKCVVAKVLVNPPEHILEKETYTLAKEAGIAWDEITDSFRDDVRDYFDFEGKMKLEDRIRLFHFKKTDDDEVMIKKCVGLARDYYKILQDLWNEKNRLEMDVFDRLIKN